MGLGHRVAFFIVEILSALLYYYGWKSMSPADHMTLGWIYFVSAWLSLFVINGILTFMLTPGTWLVTGNFWDGFFNPTFWPSLVLRSAIAVMLGGFMPSSLPHAANRMHSKSGWCGSQLGGASSDSRLALPSLTGIGEPFPRPLPRPSRLCRLLCEPCITPNGSRAPSQFC